MRLTQRLTRGARCRTARPLSAWRAVALCAVFCATPLLADAGVIIPSNVKNRPDLSILSLEDMAVRVVVDQRMARVSVIQVYASHVPRVLEGTYLFSFPPGGALSDFAVWDGVTRIPGVILEKKRAAEIYKELSSQAIDPGLLQMGGSDSASGIPASFFTVKVAPIPPNGFKRVELEFQQYLSVEGGRVSFSLPLKSQVFEALRARNLRFSIEVSDGRPLIGFALANAAYPVALKNEGENRVTGSYGGEGVILSQDLGFSWKVDVSKPDSVCVAWRGKGSDLSEGAPVTASDKPGPDRVEDGYFLLEQVFPAAPGKRPPVAVVLALDVSLSMWWGKLRNADAALQSVCSALGPDDSFNLILANDRVKPVFEALVPATPENLKKASDSFHATVLARGTDPVPAVKEGVKQLSVASQQKRYLVLLGDWVPTVGHVTNPEVLKALEPLPAKEAARISAVLVGDDANKPLLDILSSRTGGETVSLGAREEAGAEIGLFASHLGMDPFSGLGLSVSGGAVEQVYPAVAASVFHASSAAWVGRYKTPGERVFTVGGKSPDGSPFAHQNRASLPESDTSHPLLPRRWAKARVDFLLEKINREGEDKSSIAEIIALSKKYKFVTPYTSFLAAPRSLLRPRVIQPMDPVIRVQADPSTVAASVFLPWGENLPMRFLPRENVWQARFVVPPFSLDGEHRCTIVLKDGDGRLYREEKSFVVDSRPPEAKWLNPVSEVRAGDTVQIAVDAPPDTRTITVSLSGWATARLQWDPASRACTGRLSVPSRSPAGPAVLTLTAEDAARNLFRRDYQVRIQP